MEANEVWKPIEGHKGYLISDHGRAMNARVGRILRPCETSSGYLYIRCNGKNICVHIAVADAFVPKPETEGKRLIVHHVNGNRHDNRAENLLWLSDENHLKIHGVKERVRKAKSQKYAGEDANGKIKVWNSREEAMSYFGVPFDTFTFAYLWDTTIKDKDGMEWKINRVLEIQDGNGNATWKTPRTIKQTKAERRVLDNYIKKTLKN